MDRPIFAIFLDINGVIYKIPFGGIDFKVKKLYPGHKGTFTNEMCNVAATHLFDKKALENLDTLINKKNETMNVQIIISSGWRTIYKNFEDIKNLFCIHNFGKYVHDKTINAFKDSDESCYCCVKDDCRCRDAEINHYLLNHKEITDYVVIDDYDIHLTENFGEKFIKVDFDKLLTTEQIEGIIKQI